MLKSLEEGAMTELTRICQDIYTTGVWPEDFLQSIIIPIKKKPNATACEDHRTISLLTHASKVMIIILTKRIQAKTEATGGLGDDQFGFRKGMGTRDAIGTLRVLLTERSIQNGQDVHGVRMKSSTQQKVSQLFQNCKYLPAISNSTTLTIPTRDPKAVWKYS